MVFWNARLLLATSTVEMRSRARTFGQRSTKLAPRMMMPREIAMQWVAGRGEWEACERKEEKAGGAIGGLEVQLPGVDSAE